MRRLKFLFWRRLSELCLSLGGRVDLLVQRLDAAASDYEARSWRYLPDEDE